MVLNFNEYQRQAHKLDEKKKRSISIFGLVGEVGSIVGTLKKRYRTGRTYPGFEAELAEELGDALWYLSSLASLCKLSLNEIAEKNLAKARSLFAEGEITRYDRRYPADERFPRRFEVRFTEKKIDKSVLVKASVNGVMIGDNLTDNTYDQDGYRYHDAFHLAYVAVLGWSPVVRAILRRKRKSKPIVDENEDGARATAVEEALSIFIFNHGKKTGFYENSDQIEFSLLQAVIGLVGELEVKSCTAKQWNRAILAGYRVFRDLKRNRGGYVSVDMDKCSITYQRRTPIKRS